MPALHSFDGGKQSLGQRLTDDSHLRLCFHIFLREWLAVDKAEGKDFPESAVGKTGSNLEGLYVCDRHLIISPEINHTACHLLHMGQSRKHLVHYIIGHAAVDGPVLGLSLRIAFQGLQHQRAVAVILGIDRAEFDVEDDEQRHHQRDGQTRAHHVDTREEAVLPHQGPGLFEVVFQHNYVFVCFTTEDTEFHRVFI